MVVAAAVVAAVVVAVVAAVRSRRVVGCCRFCCSSLGNRFCTRLVHSENGHWLCWIGRDKWCWEHAYFNKDLRKRRAL